MKHNELLIFVRGQWEIAHKALNNVTGKTQWERRDTSFICAIGDESEKADLPEKPRRTKQG